MSTSPLPPDPYEALGVPKNAELATIRMAHRKLVLKCHPDRIQDEALREKGKNEFQRVQQAYELLSDPQKRSRYDDQVKLAELRREHMAREPYRPTGPITTTTYSARSASGATPTIRREMRSDGAYYEEREPQSSYFDPRDRPEETMPRATARKADPYERKPPPSKPSEKKDREREKEREREREREKEREKEMLKEKARTGWDGPMKGMSMKMAFNLRDKAAAAKERVREDHARNTKTRDKEERRERSEKHAGRRTAYAQSDSESDTILYPKKESGRESRTPPRSGRRAHSPESIKRHPAGPPRRSSYTDDESYDEAIDKWEARHQETRQYIAASHKRPGMPRAESSAHTYWEKDQHRDRRSGSDTEKRPTSSSKPGRRSAADEARARPSMPVHSSVPNNLKPQFVDREPSRSKTSYPERDPRREAPTFKRADTMPVPKIPRKENAPSRGSSLKHGENILPDSGYDSRSSPHTPEMRGDSPGQDKRRETTRYTVVDAASDDEYHRQPRSRLAKMVDEADRRRFQSPESDRDDRDGRRDRERPLRPRLDTDTRARSSRTPYSPAEARPNLGRGESARYEHVSPRESPPGRGDKLYREYSPDPRRGYEPNPAKVSTRGPAPTAFAPYRGPLRDDYDDVPGSKFRAEMRQPNIGTRRPSVY